MPVHDTITLIKGYADQATPARTAPAGTYGPGTGIGGPAPHGGPTTPTPTRAPTSESHSGREGLTLPMPWVYWIATGAVVLFATVWWGGVLAGKKDAERRFGRVLSPPEGTDAGNTPPATPEGQNPGPETPPNPSVRAPEPAGGGNAAPTGSGELYASSGWTDTDPRQKGMNYLQLATLPKSDAVRVVEYLKGKGKAALAVPSRAVERGPDAGKNPGYFVYLLTPLTRDQYRDGKTAVRIENEIKAIGKDWQKSKDRGPTAFAQPGWVKFD